MTIAELCWACYTYADEEGRWGSYYWDIRTTVIIFGHKFLMSRGVLYSDKERRT